VRPLPLSRRNGFTLVEMLVALFVFGLISAAGVALLRSSADGQILLREKLGERATLSRLANLIEADLAQAVPRPVRGPDGNARPAFEAGGDALLAFSRIGIAADGETSRSSLARVSYRLEAGRLLRAASAEGSSAGSDAVLIEGLKDARLSLREANGGWRDDWSAVDPEIMPRAAELRLTTDDGRSFRMLFLVGAVPQSPQEAEGDPQDG
jgi:general secretion pathway protein J